MIRKLLPSVVLGAALAWGALASAAMAQDRGPPGAPRGAEQEPGRSARQAPLSRVLATIAQRIPGRQLNTTMSEAGGRPVYVVQWQRTDGRVVVITVDAESGQIIG